MPRRRGALGRGMPRLSARRRARVPRLSRGVVGLDNVCRHGDGILLGYRLGNLLGAQGYLRGASRPARIRQYGRFRDRRRARLPRRGRRPCNRPGGTVRLARVQPAKPLAHRSRHAERNGMLHGGSPSALSRRNGHGAELSRLPHEAGLGEWADSFFELTS